MAFLSRSYIFRAPCCQYAMFPRSCAPRVSHWSCVARVIHTIDPMFLWYYVLRVLNFQGPMFLCYFVLRVLCFQGHMLPGPMFPWCYTGPVLQESYISSPVCSHGPSYQRLTFRGSCAARSYVSSVLCFRGLMLVLCYNGRTYKGSYVFMDLGSQCLGFQCPMFPGFCVSRNLHPTPYFSRVPCSNSSMSPTPYFAGLPGCCVSRHCAVRVLSSSFCFIALGTMYLIPHVPWTINSYSST